MISGFRRDVDAICALLGYYAAYSSNSLPTLRDNISVPFRESRNSWVRMCYYTLRNNPAYDMNLTDLTRFHLLNPKQSNHFILYSTSHFNASIFIVYCYKYQFNNTALLFQPSSKTSCYQNPIKLFKFPQRYANPVRSSLTSLRH